MCGELLCELRHDSFTDQLSIAIAVLIPPQAIAIAIVKCTLKYNVNVNVNSALTLMLQFNNAAFTIMQQAAAIFESDELDGEEKVGRRREWWRE